MVRPAVDQMWMAGRRPWRSPLWLRRFRRCPRPFPSPPPADLLHRRSRCPQCHHTLQTGQGVIITFVVTLLLDLRSIGIGGAQGKEGQFHNIKNLLRASKRGITCHICPKIISKSLCCGLKLTLIHSKEILGESGSVWHVIPPLRDRFVRFSTSTPVLPHIAL